MQIYQAEFIKESGENSRASDVEDVRLYGIEMLIARKMPL